MTFAGRDLIVIAAGRSAKSRAVLPAGRDGTWQVDAVAVADVGASA